jgi:hypothetical protein
MKRVSVSFVLRFSGFQITAEVEFGAHTSHRASNLERPRPSAALIPSKVRCGRQDRSWLTVLCPSCFLFHKTRSQKPWEFFFSARKHPDNSETAVWYRTTQQIFFLLYVPCVLFDIHIYKQLNTLVADTFSGMVFDHWHMFRHVRAIVTEVFRPYCSLKTLSCYIHYTKRNAGTSSMTHRTLHNVPDDTHLCHNSRGVLISP